MKTHLQILTALALIIQVMVKGQTQENQAENTKHIEVTHKKMLPVLGKTQTNTTHYNTQKSNLKVSGSISAYNKSLQIKGTKKDVKELLLQTEEMLSIEKQLRAQAKTKTGNEKLTLIESANNLAKQIELIHIQASEINGKVNLETFTFNKEIYLELLKDPNVNDNFVQISETLNQEAEQSIKLAKEIRQEAYAMPTNGAKLGTMLNAEEKEETAITKQQEAIQILNKMSTSVMAVK